MNWPRTILDGIAMALLLNAVVGVGFLLYPQAYSTMFPKEIREAQQLTSRSERYQTQEHPKPKLKSRCLLSGKQRLFLVRRPIPSAKKFD